MEQGTLYFHGIDSWDRPVFKEMKTGLFYGSVTKLFENGNTRNNIAMLTEADLCYFGETFDCEPMGDKLPEGLRIRREL